MHCTYSVSEQIKFNVFCNCLLFANCRHETLQIITSDVEHCCCTHSLLYAVCLEHTHGLFVVYSLFTRHSLLLYMYTMSCSFRCKYPLYFGKLSKVNKCYVIINVCGRTTSMSNKHEYHMLPVAIR